MYGSSSLFFEVASQVNRNIQCRCNIIRTKPQAFGIISKKSTGAVNINCGSYMLKGFSATN